MATILYLGLIPSGLAFFLWNAGARRGSAGIVAVLNNAKVPLAVLVSWVVFESAPGSGQIARTLVAVALITIALWLAQSRPSHVSQPSAPATS